MANASTNAERLREWSPLSDEEVVARVLAGETALYEVLMRRYNQRIYRAIRAILKDESEVEEVMQQSYVAAYSHLGQFTSSAKFSTWLTRIAINEELARRRRAARLTAIEDVARLENAPMAEPDAAENPEERASRRELAGILEHAIDELPEMYRSALMLREIEGMNTAEAATVLSITEDALKMRLHRAKQLVRESVHDRIQSHAFETFPFYAPRCDRVVAAVLEIIGNLKPTRISDEPPSE